MNNKFKRVLQLGLMTCLPLGMAQANTLDEPVLHPAIPILDEEGAHVLNSGKPYSPRTTCGISGCHDYDSITHAFHIEQGRDETSDDYGVLRGLPQLVGPGYFGGYNCMTGNNPDQLAKKSNASANEFADLGSAGWIQRCGSCHSGGGWMEKDRKGRRYDQTDPSSVTPLDGDYYNRGTDQNNQSTDDSAVVSQWNWQKSGVVENDCMQCHADTDNLKTFDAQLNVEGASEAADLRSELRMDKLIKAGHFRYANTAMLEFINLDLSGQGAASNLVRFSKGNVAMVDNGHGGESLGYDLRLRANGEPILHWNASAFDANQKVAIPMVRFPTNETCYTCHRTAASRRGFYGFGEDDAAPTYDDENGGVLVEDYQDDVHYGLDWTEANGETRTMTSCNACHARNYYRESYVNTDLDADHNFLKGNSDMDIRNDLDYEPNAKSCVYCHDDAENPAIPSGQEDMLNAHLVRWRSAGDMAGYPAGSLEQVTQTHLDQLSCMSCHITDKEYRGSPMQIMYRNRRSEDGKLRIVPYSSRPRYFWQDKNSGRVLTATERNSVFRRVDGVGELFDPETGETLTTVDTRFSHGAWRFSDPSTYEGFVAWKQAYDKVLSMKGVRNPDTALVWTEVNNYIMTHNTRPAVSAVQCEDCHARKQNGSFSALISDDGVLGPSNVKSVVSLPDKRLVDEGIVILDRPYMKVDAAGGVTQNVEDLLYYTLANPSLSALDADVATVVQAGSELMSTEAGVQAAELASDADRSLLTSAIASPEMYLYESALGTDSVRQVKVMIGADSLSRMFMSDIRFRVDMPEKFQRFSNAQVLDRYITTDPIMVQAVNTEGDTLTSLFDAEFLVRIPYRGSASAEDLIVYVSGDGYDWLTLGPESIVAHQPATEYELGYTVVRTSQLGYMGVADHGRQIYGAL